MLAIVADRGLDQLSVREVAAATKVSIGTVQHHFRTKDEMLAAAYSEVVRRIRDRLLGARRGTDVRRNIAAVLAELLPLDERRAAEVRIHLAFAARASTMPALAAIQRDALTEIHQALTEAFAAAGRGKTARSACVRAAHAALAVADGVALHAVSSGGWITPRQQSAVVGVTLDGLAQSV